MLRHNSEYKKEVKSIFEEMIYNINFIDAQVNGNCRSMLKLRKGDGGYAYLLAIELFAIQVLTIRMSPFQIFPKSYGSPDIVKTPIGKSLIDLLSHKSENYEDLDLSPYADAFFLALRETNLITDDFLKRLNNKILDSGDANACSEFVEIFRSMIEGKNFKLDYISQKSKVNATNKAAVEYVNSLFANTNGLVVVSIDLGESLNQLSTVMSREESEKIIRQKFQVFLKKCRSKKPTSLMVGYLGKFETSPIKGHYARLLMFFDSDIVVGSEQDICHEIGQYWSRDIAPNIGTYHCSPISKNVKQLKSPVCLIKTSDNATRDLLCKSVVPYITKSRMFARPKLPKGVDLFFRGKIKKPSS